MPFCRDIHRNANMVNMSIFARDHEVAQNVRPGQAGRYSIPADSPHPWARVSSHIDAVLEIEGIQSQTAKLSAYGSLLDGIYSSPLPSSLTDNLRAFIDAILAESVSLVITRPALVDFVSRLDSLKDVETKKQVLIFALDKVHPRAVSFEEQAATIREKLADIYEEEGAHNAAYRALSGITLDSGQRYPAGDGINSLCQGDFCGLQIWHLCSDYEEFTGGGRGYPGDAVLESRHIDSSRDIEERGNSSLLQTLPGSNTRRNSKVS